jgi:AraC family transcriptional activator of pobA
LVEKQIVPHSAKAAYTREFHMNGIPIIKEINDGHEQIGSHLRTDNPLFHCFNISNENHFGLGSYPAHRADFFILIICFGNKGLSFTLNETVFENAESFILCVAPGQVMKFKKNNDWNGCCMFFKSEFIRYKSGLYILEDFPFFNIRETNLFPINELQFKSILPIYEQIIAEQANHSAFHTDVIRSLSLAMLWQVRRVYENFQTKKTDKPSAVITSQFQYLVNKHFIDKILVEEYANILNITSNHLSQTIRETTGKTAKSFIVQRRLEEAKYLLKHTTNDIAEISYHLNFLEPTHFNKFFKKEVSATPLQYRQKGA